MRQALKEVSELGIYWEKSTAMQDCGVKGPGGERAECQGSWGGREEWSQRCEWRPSALRQSPEQRSDMTGLCFPQDALAAAGRRDCKGEGRNGRPVRGPEPGW